MALFVREAGSAIDLAQLATDVESRQMQSLCPLGIRVLIIGVSCIHSSQIFMTSGKGVSCASLVTGDEH
jgi:hypothetical protein